MSKQKKESKIKVLDLFAGAGGFGLGFSKASGKYNIICSLEVDKWAVDTLKKNNSHNQKIIFGDIRDFDSPERIEEACPECPDVIIGGPPCQGFSVANTKVDHFDPRNSLFNNFSQWVDVLKPRLFVMENVKGILNRKNRNGEKVIDIIKKTFESIGYKTTIWKLNAANYGVPQHRERVFIIGSSISNKEISAPKTTHFLPKEKRGLNGSAKNLNKAINVIQAIGDLPKLTAGEGTEIADFSKKTLNNYQRSCRGRTKKLYNHVTMSHTKRVVKRYEQIINGVSIENLSDELKVRKRNGNGILSESNFHSNYRHLKPQMISYTIPASFYSNFIHPNQPRNITSREAARLQSFPDSYFFQGKRTQVSSKLLLKLGKEHENYLSQYNQIGNAVPPLLAKAVALRLIEFFE